MKTPVLSGAFPTGFVGGTRYLSLSGGLTSGWQASNTSAECVMPIAGTFRNLRVSIQTAPGVGFSWTFKLYVNGADTGLTATISDTATTASDLSDAVHVSVGDKVCWKATSPASTTASGNIALSCEFEGDTAGETFVAGVGNSSPTTAGVQYCSPVGFGGWNATENSRQIVFPTAGTIDLLRIETSSSQGSSGSGISRTYTLRQNAVDTAITTTITETSTSGSDLTHSISVAQGDVLSISCNVAGGTANAASSKISFRFIPTVDGESIIATAIAAPSNTATTYENLNGNGTTTTEANAANIAPIAFSLQKLCLSGNSAPGASPIQFVVTSRINGANGGLTATLTGAAVTTANDNTNVVNVSAGDLLNWATVPSNTPTSPGILRYAAVAYVAPSAGGGGGANSNLTLLGVG